MCSIVWRLICPALGSQRHPGSVQFAEEGRHRVVVPWPPIHLSQPRTPALRGLLREASQQPTLWRWLTSAVSYVPLAGVSRDTDHLLPALRAVGNPLS